MNQIRNEFEPSPYLPLAVMSLDPTGKGRARWTNRWKAPLNAFTVAFPGRIITSAQQPTIQSIMRIGYTVFATVSPNTQKGTYDDNR